MSTIQPSVGFTGIVELTSEEIGQISGAGWQDWATIGGFAGFAVGTAITGDPTAGAALSIGTTMIGASYGASRDSGGSSGGGK